MRSNAIYYSEDSGVYPGVYESPSLFGLADQNSRRKRKKVSHPSAKMVEFQDYYRIELPVHGFSREDISASIQGQHLTICCVHRESCIRGEGFDSHYACTDCIEKEVNLPQNADVDFATAEFKDGTLYIFVFKTLCPNHFRKVNVAVY